MKITIEGEIDLKQFAAILNELGEFKMSAIKPEPQLSGEVKGNFTPEGIKGTGGPGTGPGEGHPVGALTPAADEPAKRTRRTKAEIEAEKTAPANPLTPVDPEKETNGFTFEELKAFAQEKAQTPENVPKIKAKLKEFGVSKTKELPAENHNAYYVFLQAL